MRIVILGAGGIGSIVAAFFARAGHDATLIARGEHLRATRERGIRVTGRRRAHLRLLCDLVRARSA